MTCTLTKASRPYVDTVRKMGTGKPGRERSSAGQKKYKTKGKVWIKRLKIFSLLVIYRLNLALQSEQAKKPNWM